jgi:hypothetical protein
MMLPALVLALSTSRYLKMSPASLTLMNSFATETAPWFDSEEAVAAAALDAMGAFAGSALARPESAKHAPMQKFIPKKRLLVIVFTFILVAFCCYFVFSTTE